MIEHHAGLLPAWLAPRQVSVLSITDQSGPYAAKVTETLKNQGVRADSDLRNEKIGLKIREHTLQRVPFMLIVGEREVENSTIAVRTRGGEDLGSMSLDDFVTRLREGPA